MRLKKRKIKEIKSSLLSFIYLTLGRSKVAIVRDIRRLKKLDK